MAINPYILVAIHLYILAVIKCERRKNVLTPLATAIYRIFGKKL